LCSGPEAHEHAGFGGFTRIEEYGFLGEGDVYAGQLDFRERHHGTFELAFDRPAIVDVFGEVGGREVGLVEDFEADASGLGKSQAGHLEAQLGELGFGDQDGGAAVGDAVLDAFFLQLLHHRAGVLGREGIEQRAEVALVLPFGEPHQAGDGGGDDNERGEALGGAQG